MQSNLKPENRQIIKIFISNLIFGTILSFWIKCLNNDMILVSYLLTFLLGFSYKVFKPEIRKEDNVLKSISLGLGVVTGIFIYNLIIK